MDHVTIPKCPVIVIGAGMAGIKAARVLQNSNLHDVTILEGRPDRYGGRIWTNYEAMNGSTGVEADMGASWICDDDIKNTGMRITLANRIPTVFSDILHPRVYHGNNSHIHDDEWTKIFKIYRQIIFDIFPVYLKNLNLYGLSRDLKLSKQNSSEITNGDISLKDSIRLLGFSELFNYSAFAFLNSHLIEADIGTEFDLTSAKMFNEITAKNTRIIPQGYATILKPLVNGSNEQEQPLKILLDKEVISIMFDKDPINETGGCLEVKTKKGEIFKARAVILAVPLGVLKANTIRFDENLLSKNVRTSINKLGFGVMNKIHLKFDEIFWPRSYHAFGLLPSKDICKDIDFKVREKFVVSNRSHRVSMICREKNIQGEVKLINDSNVIIEELLNKQDMHISDANYCDELDASLYHSWINGYLYTGQKVLIGYAMGKAAKFTEKLSDTTVKNIAFGKLRAMFGNKLNNVKIVNMIRSKWHNDKFARGTWTYPSIGSTPNDWESFSQLKGPLFIAGEHAHFENTGTVSGAYYSGVNAARAVLNYLYKHYPRECTLENIDLANLNDIN
ncbi:unnamed protein product [Gordionus sp. m RMFG-2023]